MAVTSHPPHRPVLAGTTAYGSYLGCDIAGCLASGNHAQCEEWVTSGQRSDPASAKWVAVDYAGTESCTRGAPPGAGIETASLGSPVPHGIDSIRVARSAAILRPLQSARASSGEVPASVLAASSAFGCRP